MTNKPGIGLCYGSVGETTAPELIAIAGAHGFSAVMLPLRPAGIESAEAFRQLLDRHGITRVVLDGAMGMLPRCAFAEQHGITAAQHFEVAALCHVDCFNVPHYQGDPDTPVNEFADRLGSFCERAARTGSSVALEFLPGTGMPDMERVLRIIEATGAPNLGMTLDTWHWARCKASLADIRALPRGIIKDFQINDRAAGQDALPDSDQYGRLAPGEGDLPLVEIIRAVRVNAPELPASIEVFSHDLQAADPSAAAGHLARQTRRVIDQL